MMTKRMNAPAAMPNAKGVGDSEVRAAAQAVTAAGAVVADIESQMCEARARQSKLEKTRHDLSFAAHGTGDKAAGDRLKQIHRDVAEAVSEVTSFQAALEEARSRVQGAAAAHRRAVERRDALRVLAQIDHVAALVAPLDENARRYFDNLVEVFDALGDLARAGPGRPSSQQVRIFAGRAILTHAMPARHVLSLPILAPDERVTFGEVTATWLASISSWATERLTGAQDDPAQ